MKCIFPRSRPARSAQEAASQGDAGTYFCFTAAYLAILLSLAGCGSPLPQSTSTPIASPPPTRTEVPPPDPATPTRKLVSSPSATATSQGPFLPSALSPGEYLAYIKGPFQLSLCLRHVDTALETWVSDNVGEDAALHFPSGLLATTLFEFSGGAYPDGLFRVTDIASGDVLISSTEGLKSPSWSPDGAYLVATLGTDLAIISLSGGPPTVIARCSDLSPDGEWMCGAASWSPDGQRIAYVQSVSQSGDPHPDEGVYILDIESLPGGKWLWHRTHGPLPGIIFSGPSWSPDSRYIAFPTREGIEVFDVDQGVSERELKLDFIPDSLVWAPDGQRLAVTANGYLSIVDAQSGIIEFQLPDLSVQAVIAWLSLPLAPE